MISRALFLFLLFSAMSTNGKGQRYYFLGIDSVLLEMQMLVCVRSDRVGWSGDHERRFLLNDTDYPARLIDWSLKLDSERPEILRVPDLPPQFVFIACRQYNTHIPKNPDSLRQVRQQPMLYDYWGEDTARQRKGYCLFIACVDLRNRKLYRLRGFKKLDTKSFFKVLGYKEMKKLELPFLDVDCMYRKRKFRRKDILECETDTTCTASCNCSFGIIRVPGYDKYLSDWRKQKRKWMKKSYKRYYH